MVKPYLVPNLYADTMYSFTVIHESCNLKQAMPKGRDVDLLRLNGALATPS